MNQLLDTSITFLKGVGPQRAELLNKELRIYTYQQLLHYFPFRHIDRSKCYQIAELAADMPMIQLKGFVKSIQEIGTGHKKRLRAILHDGSNTLELVWFKGVKWVKSGLQEGKEYLVFGKPTLFNGKFNIAHPEIELYDEQGIYAKGALQPVYHASEKLNRYGLNSKGIEKLMKQLLLEISETIPEILAYHLLQENKLLGRKEAFSQIHFPSNHQNLKRAQTRLKYEELLFLQMLLVKQKLLVKQHVKGFKFTNLGDYFMRFYEKHLPFELTNAQKRVVREIRRDMNTGAQMNRLIQGDVGSGKTLVAFLSMLVALDNGFQACLMAPTEILANQHLQSLSGFAEELGINIQLLTGSSKTAKRRVIHEQLESGELQLLIGTHALLEDKVKFKNLGLAIVDEQHRFGVAQRAKFWKKNTTPPHMLVMTATPIPRTLAMTVYGDLDVSVIDEMPPGRKPVSTSHRFDSHRLSVFGFMDEQIKLGRQIYVVYPLIEESEKLDYKDLMDGYESISRRFPLPKYGMSIVHGRMKPADKDYEMQQFAEGKTHIMVATTVIEVGVNVPNASVMIIESAERFGLSQLHQLRGRVGRGADQSYCILMSGNKLSKEARQRLKTMVDTSDGFQISEVDLKLRGPGDIMGTQQSGLLDLKIADLVRDGAILEKARKDAIKILDEDPELKLDKNLIMHAHLNKLYKKKASWSRIA
jgi:ATP-dependent DNA helicase RecG